MKKPMIALLSLALVGAMAVPAFAAEPEQPILISEAPALISTNTAADTGRYIVQVNGKDTDMNVCVMVPLRAIAKELGFTVTWNNGTVLVDDGTMHTEITIGEDRYLVATSVEGVSGTSAPFSLGAAPYVTDGVTYVPLSLFDALLGSKEGAVTIDGNKIIIKTGSTDNTEIPSPFTDCDTLEEAGKLAGFDMTAPDTINGYSERVIRAVAGDMIEAIYRSGEDEVRIRKAAGSEDISGDYNVYAENNVISVDGLQVTMKGTDGKVNVATWTNSGYTFAIGISSGMSSDSVSALIRTVK
jgi:hypothetical protein